jgi:hypothetical protein
MAPSLIGEMFWREALPALARASLAGTPAPAVQNQNQILNEVLVVPARP